MSVMQRFLTRNVGNTDRLFRALPAAIFAYVWATGTLTGTILIAFGILSVMLLLTALTGRCSIYAILGLSTCPAKQKSS